MMIAELETPITSISPIVLIPLTTVFLGVVFEDSFGLDLGFGTTVFETPSRSFSKRLLFCATVPVYPTMLFFFAKFFLFSKLLSTLILFR